MKASPSDTRRNPRRLCADRRRSTQRRSSVDRRQSQRRVAVTTVDVQRRSIPDRRTDTDRRQSERRAGVTRRFAERRQETDTNRVLLVDGDVSVRERLKRVLLTAGLEVVEAYEGHAGLSYSGETPADAVVVNLTLPDMDGVEFIRQLCQTFDGAKVVAIAGRKRYGAPDPLALATSLGDVRGLRWPFAPDAFMQAVRDALQNAS